MHKDIRRFALSVIERIVRVLRRYRTITAASPELVRPHRTSGPASDTTTIDGREFEEPDLGTCQLTSWDGIWFHEGLGGRNIDHRGRFGVLTEDFTQHI